MVYLLQFVSVSQLLFCTCVCVVCIILQVVSGDWDVYYHFIRFCLVGVSFCCVCMCVVYYNLLLVTRMFITTLYACLVDVDYSMCSNCM